MRLFGQQGYRATSVNQIEKAAGLVPGCGALYNHFKSKQELLSAVVDRQLDRRRAMHDISALFAGSGDLRTELPLLGRYLITGLDQESEFLQVAARPPADASPRLTDAFAALVDGLRSELGDWITGCAPALDPSAAARIPAGGGGAARRPRLGSPVVRRRGARRRPRASPGSASMRSWAGARRESCSTPTTSTQPRSTSRTGPI